MTQPIVFTPQELITTVLAICAGIVSVSAAITVIVRFITRVKAPEERQNNRISKCEQDITEIKERFKVYDGYFEHDKKRLGRLEFGNEAENRALLALLNHAIHGDNTDELKAAKKELEQYLVTTASKFVSGVS